MFGNFGPTEILIICAIVLIFFGAKRLPDLAKGLGKGLKQFRSEVRDVTRDVIEPIDELKSHLK